MNEDISERFKASQLKSPAAQPFGRAAKRLIDITGGALGLLVASPFIAVAALAIRVEGPGPIFHRRRVVGRGGVEFDAFKLRTMVPDADRVLHENPALRAEFERSFKLVDDPRVTKVGRWLRRTSVDEFPQFFNIFRGEMSLVGPRMLSPAELAKYGDAVHRVLAVKPGAAGPWVAAGRQDVSYEERVKLDLAYVEQWSLLLDLKLLLRSFLSLLSMRGAH